MTYLFESGTYLTLADFGRILEPLNDSKSLMFFWNDKVFLAHHSDPQHARELVSGTRDQISGLTLSRDNRTAVFGRTGTEADIRLATLESADASKLTE